MSSRKEHGLVSARDPLALRAVSLPAGATIKDAMAAFSSGVFEISVPLAVQENTKGATVEITETEKTAKPAA